MDEIEKCVKECIKKGTFAALKEAIALSDQLIEEFEMQPLDTLEYRDDLAEAHMNRGNALANLSTPDSFQDAVEAYDKAIALRNKLPMDNPKYRNNLAIAHRKRGIALADMGTLDSLQKAIVAYDRAIALQTKLPLDNSKYRSNLAQAYMNRGGVLVDLGTPDSLQAAVAAYDEAISLRNELPLNNPEYRNDLAWAHTNRGIVLEHMGTLDSLQDALYAYDKAIAIRNELPIDIPEYRNDLAGTHMSRGNALKIMGTADSLRAAVSAYDKAIALQSELPMDNPEYRSALAGTHMNRGYALKIMGTPDCLQAAVSAYDKAIAIQNELPLDNPEYRNNLAMTYVNHGNVLSAIGTPDSHQAALLAYDEAITIQDELLLDSPNPRYRNNLAGTHMTRGDVLRDINTPGSLQAAVSAYDKAIVIQNELPLDNPEYRNDLAVAYRKRGIALADMGTPDSLQDALYAYNKAIGIQNELPLDNLKYLNDLAEVHTYHGNALVEIGTPDSLQAAVSAYDKAIAIQNELPLDNPDYRNDLAWAHIGRGNALVEIGTPDSLQAAVSAYDKAIHLAEELDINALSHSELIAIAYREKTMGCLQIFHKEPESKKRKAYLEKAGDSADDGLEILRNLEKAGCLVLRDLRESLFEICLDVYRILNPRFVPEIVMENLDPEEPGSCPESAAMHQTALYALVDLLRRLPLGAGVEERVGNDEIIEEIVDVIRYLLTIRTRYFAGTSAAARLQAGYYEMAGDSGRAREILESYRERRPKDPEGHLALADFHRRRTDSAAAVVSYELAAACLLNSLPETVSLDETEIAAESLLNLGDTVCHLLLDDWPSLKVPGAVQRVNARYERIWSWLARFEKIHEECLKGRLSDAMDELKARLRQEQQEWFERFEAAVQATAWEDAASQLKDWVAGNENRWKAKADAMLRTFCSGISVRWDSFVEALKAALGDLWDHYGPEWDEAHERSDAEEMARIEEEIAHGLSLALSREAARVSSFEKQVECDIAEKALGSIWPTLAEDERQGLIAGLYCIGNDMVHQFAGLAFGQVVETALSNRVMWPLREAFAKADHTLDIPAGKGPVTWAADFLNRKKNHLMLGQLVGIFNKALYSSSRETDPDGDVFGLIRGHLNRLPSAGLLLTTDPEVQDRRKCALNFINDVRVRSAHAKEKSLSADEAQRSWELLALEPNVAFLHYFIGAHLEPEQKAAEESGET